MTPHLEASPGDYAETVLVPGDPMRAEWIARTFLSDVRCVNGVRGCYGFTGSFRGLPISLQATGMGRPSFTIYVHELVAFYGVRTIIRTGSCGGLTAAMPLRGVFVCDRAVMDTDLEAAAPFVAGDPHLYQRALRCAQAMNLGIFTGPMVSSDVFYHPTPETRFDLPRSLGIRAVDMETANLYALAGRLGFRALSICTLVDNLQTGEETALSERHELFRDMARLALDVAHDDIVARQTSSPATDLRPAAT
jgi:purine-nucleoside phosphorylase